MDSSLNGVAGEGDSSKCSEMSIDEKRKLVYDLSQQSHLATEVLQAWTRHEILQILCAEMGKERKYTGLTKVKIIEALLKIVSEKKDTEDKMKKRDGSESDCSLPVQKNIKRQRKVDNPIRHVAPLGTNPIRHVAPMSTNPIRHVAPMSNTNVTESSNSVNTKAVEKPTYCNNLACRAILRQEDTFCRRCSCCICRNYDDNKDPSLWLTCNSDPPFETDSCGYSSHLECALKIEKSGLTKDEGYPGCFYCVSCGKQNSLLECWKKQLTIAKETRRVDELCYRLFLVRKLLKGKYRNVVDEAVKCLETDVGPLTGLPMKMGRGIVNRLQSGPNVQKLCSSALELIESIDVVSAALPSLGSSKMQQDCSADTETTTKIRFEDVNSTSLTVILASNEVASHVHYGIWHRKVTENEYPEKSTCTLFTPNTRFVVSGLAPSSEYSFKVVSFTGTKELGIDEINVSTRNNPEGGRSESPLSTLCSTPSIESEENAAKRAKIVEEVEEEEEAVPAPLPITPYKSDRRNGKSVKDNGSANGGTESGLEYCVKVIREIECLGHIKKDFRQKFLTWFTLRANAQEIRVVKIFVDMFSDDLVALAEQLVDTFGDRVSVKRSAVGSGGGASAVVPAGFCMKMWH